MNLQGETVEQDADGLLATCVQHEIDHLNGVLFIDYLSKLKRDRVMTKFKKAAKREAAGHEPARRLHGHAGFRGARPSPRSSARATTWSPSIPAPPAAAGRGMELRPSPVHRMADRFGLPVLQRRRPCAPRRPPRSSASHDADVAVVVAYGMLLPKAILEAPELGCLNLHASLLPRWRGAAPIQRAIMAGDKETGIAVMKMEEGLDTGPVAMVERVGDHAGHECGRAARPADGARRRPDGAGARRLVPRRPRLHAPARGGRDLCAQDHGTRKR